MNAIKKTNNTSVRLKEYMDKNNIKQVDILKRAEPYCKQYNVKLTKQDLSQYVSGKTEPNQDKLAILSMALNVDITWLMGFDVPMERSDKKLNNIDEKMIIEKYNKLNKKQKENLLDYAEFLLQQQKDK